MIKKYFGTDGVRGRVGTPPMTPDVLVRLGFVAGRVLGEGRASPQVLVSKDTRLSGYMVESALEAGFAAAGADVLLSGPLPTSGVSYLTQTLRLSAGVVISASHNPHGDNGVKFFGADGQKLSDDMENKIELGMRDSRPLSFNKNPGRARRLDAAADRYIEFCKRAFPADMSLRGMRLLADCANGAAYHVAPPVLHELGAEVIPFAASPDGININVGCGVMHPQAAAKQTKAGNAAAGIILDGDGDRVFLADEKGKIHDGDAILFLLAKRRYCNVGKGNSKTNSEKTSGGIAGTVMSNLALERAAREMGMDFYRAGVGDRNVWRALVEKGWQLGGEPSGHLVLRDLHCTGDGIIAALSALSIMCESGRPLSELMSDYAPCPRHSQSIAAADGKKTLAKESVRKAVAAARIRLGKDGRLVVRPSGTEPSIRLMAESSAPALPKKVVAELAAVIKAAQNG